MTAADRILFNVYKKLGIESNSHEQKYNEINAIVDILAKLNRKSTINPKTTGTISERLCELALKATVINSYNRITVDWNWMADFSILGNPFNLLISVKSFKAKERLLVSGSGNILSPTVGWGLFDDGNEWTESRTRIYLYRSFIAVYLPAKLLYAIPVSARKIRNINGKPFLRKIDNFMNDLAKAFDGRVIHIDVF